MKLSEAYEAIKNIDRFIVEKELNIQRINGKTFIVKRESPFNNQNLKASYLWLPK